MQIITANNAHLDIVLDLVRAVVSHMQETGLDQWNHVYPDQATLADDIANQTLYLLQDNQRAAGMVVLNQDQDPAYKSISWQLDGSHVMVVHRLCIHPDYRGQGLSKRLMDFTEKQARQQGCDVIRLDAYTANPAATHLYEKRGYSRAGSVRFPGRVHPFWCYEKLVQQTVRN